MNRTKLTLIVFLLSTVAAHGQSLHGRPSIESQAKPLQGNRGFIIANAAPLNSALLPIADNVSALRFDWSANQASVLDRNTRPEINATSVITQVPTDVGGNQQPDMWFVALATVGMVAWQLRRKQKSLRFDQSCLVKDVDYAAR